MEETKKKYKVVDLLESKEILGYADTMTGVKKLARQRIEDTDGECRVFYYPLNKETGKYKLKDMKFLETC